MLNRVILRCSLRKCYSIELKETIGQQKHQIRFRFDSIASKYKQKSSRSSLKSKSKIESIDNEPYYVKDFDFESSNVSDRFEASKLLKKSYRQDSVDFSRTFSQRNHQNALFDDDADDDEIKYHRRSRNFRSKNRKIISKNEDFRNSRHFHQSDRKFSKKLKPLPYEINAENRFEILQSIMMPLYPIPYGQQIKIKSIRSKNILQSFGEKLKNLNQSIRFNSHHLPCPLEPLRPSPSIDSYRNKDEFSVWPGFDDNPKTVGFFVGKPSANDRVICVEPDKIIISKQSHLDLAKKFQNYLREVSPYDVCQNYGLGGHWRRFHVRSNLRNEHMVTAIMHPQDLNETELAEEMKRFRSYFVDNSLISSLYFHTSRHTRSTHTNEPYFHLAGNETITESLFDRNFIISPSSFFQINTTAAEILYRVIMTEMKLTKRTTVLDLCCGTGVLSVLVADQVRKVIGIDSSRSAIEDAKRNADLNSVKNANFIVGTIEEELPKLLQENYLKEPVIAVVNPSRQGLHPSVIDVLKRISYIERLVYVSCKPEGDAMRNFVQLCQRSKQCATSFWPINAIPVDMFPQTEHCELIITFERFG
ncbi:tRNA (uracil(54)-C(5))-methyltransferase -like protein-B [Sarcoptes scabiei]|uniref:tRNA (uracil(54)-C(5))-methyltransferase n=2 Tax=Sarcoptes scabiei TaxID=52283 RepID=A0A834R2F1_SARSC|nr:tRNA (uracil(54)-C(5))-methyltransferase -like protein-B [Sarcoptes scabiei]